MIGVPPDRKLPVDDGNGMIAFYMPHVISTSDFYPFGVTIKERTFAAQNNRYGYQGSEVVEEIDSERNHITTYYREADLDIAQWWSVDPKLNASWSPYTMMDCNPLLYNDVLGDTIRVSESASLQFTVAVVKSILYLAKHDAADVFIAIQKHPQTITIADARTEGVSPGPNQISYYDTKTSTIYWNPDQGILTTEFESMSPAEVLNHEGDHGLQHITNPKQLRKDLIPDAKNPYDNKEEERVITGSEQKVAKKIGSIQEGKVTRRDHKGTVFPAISPISNEDKRTFTITAEQEK